MNNELSEEREGLPEGWAEVELGQLGIWGSGGTPLRTNPAFYTDSGIPWLVIGDLNDRVVYGAKNHITESGLSNSAARLLNPGTLLVAMYGSIGKLGITGIQCATNQAIAFCVPHEDLATLNFLYYTLKNEQQALIAQGQGGAQQNISQSILKAHPIPLPPLPEQIRIADKLDALLARVDAGRERLERVPKLVKRFRQAVLSAAVSGELTREWRGGGEAEWENVTVAAVAKTVFDGPFGSHLKSDDYTEVGVRVVRLENLGHLVFNESKRTYVSEEKYQSLERHTLKDQDVLFSSFVDEEIRACIYLDSYGMAINKADCFVVRCDMSECLPKMMLYVLSNGETYHTFAGNVHGATRPRINLKQLKQLEIPLPPLPEQAEIVRRVEALFALADRLEQRYQAALASFDRLTPALLAKAFRGELVPQDPNDEPASRLLERIRAQKAEGGRQKAEGRKPRGTGKDGAEPKRRGRPPRAQAEGAEETAEPRRRGRPPGTRAIPTALNEEDAVRLLQERGQRRAEGSRLVGLFEDSEPTSHDC